MTAKETNPKDHAGSTKVSLSCVPLPVLMEMALGMTEGGFKYGRHNYRVAGVRASIYFDATIRHLFDWWEGEDIDPDSRLSHITKALTSLTVLRDAMINDLWTDDRPPRAPEDWMDGLNMAMFDLIEKYPHPEAPYTETNKADGIRNK